MCKGEWTVSLPWHVDGGRRVGGGGGGLVLLGEAANLQRPPGRGRDPGWVAEEEVVATTANVGKIISSPPTCQERSSRIT